MGTVFHRETEIMENNTRVEVIKFRDGRVGRLVIGVPLFLEIVKDKNGDNK
jgi:hypothetical protein